MNSKIIKKFMANYDVYEIGVIYRKPKTYNLGEDIFFDNDLLENITEKHIGFPIGLSRSIRNTTVITQQNVDSNMFYTISEKGKILLEFEEL